VSQLSQNLLLKGWKFCCLFADLSNEISNAVYLKIGYKPVCDYDEYAFD
jgi:predicted GNAT family acetyltransferase